MEKNEYDAKVYARLELVRKQFQNNVAAQKEQEAAERRQQELNNIYNYFQMNKLQVVRGVTFSLMGALLLAVIGVMIFDAVF